MSDGRAVTGQMVKDADSRGAGKAAQAIGEERFASRAAMRRRARFWTKLMIGCDRFQDFLTLVAYDYLD